MPSFRLAAAALLVAAAPACFVDPGLTRPATSAVLASSSTSTSTGASTSSSTDPTTGPTCSVAGEPCSDECCGCLACDPGTDTCIAVDTKCGACQTCQDDGACTVAPAGAACSHDGPGCTAFVWGAIGDTCYAFAPAAGVCDGDGACIAGLCLGAGLPIFTCGSKSCLDTSVCAVGRPVEAVTFAELCSIRSSTKSCGLACEGNVATASHCDESGTCVLDDQQSCGDYVCSAGMCKTMCVENVDCTNDSVCIDGACVPP